MITLDTPSLIVAFLITVIELTEVVALVFAIGADQATLRPVALGAVCGTITIALVALGFGAVLVAFPHAYLLWVAAVVLAAFGVFLFRSTLRTYRRAAGRQPAPPRHQLVQFGGGFSVGAVETTEVVVVLLALTAGGDGASAIVGALAGGVVLVGAAAALHEQIRKIKVPWLKWGGTSLLFSYALFWGGEAAGVHWPGDDLFLIPLVIAALAIVRGAVAVGVRVTAKPAPA